MSDQPTAIWQNPYTRTLEKIPIFPATLACSSIMAVQNLTLALILNNSNDAEFLLVKQTRPPKFDDAEYDSYVDSDLWDLPSTQLKLLEGESDFQVAVHDAEACTGKIELRKFDIDAALNHVLGQVGYRVDDWGEWRFWKHMEEPEFGPGTPNHTVFFSGKLVAEYSNLQDSFKWMSMQSCLSLLLEARPCRDRIGPLVVGGLLNDLMHAEDRKVSFSSSYQEYPPGVVLVPFRSRTARPFHTTNLVIFAPEDSFDESENNNFVACGDALILDPGCRSEFHEELSKIIAVLPRKLVVFVTHHHYDHVDGLSVIQRYNPDATLLAHENTMCRIGKDAWSLGYTLVSGNEDICIRGQQLRVLFAPGHTDGHMALLHEKTNSLIVGDHCVGQGSAVLDITSGGNMSEYFQTTYKFMELSPHVLIPMHGRINLWPKHMLCEYLKNRRSRETSILTAIENGAKTLFDIVSKVYSEVDRSFWLPAASNVRLHVDHLAQQDKLPKEFSIQRFKRTCGLQFLCQWMCAYISSGFVVKYQKLRRPGLLISVAIVGFALLYSTHNKFGSKTGLKSV